MELPKRVKRTEVKSTKERKKRTRESRLIYRSQHFLFALFASLQSFLRSGFWYGKTPHVLNNTRECPVLSLGPQLADDQQKTFGACASRLLLRATRCNERGSALYMVAL